MKIGILTFHRAINYGAYMQAFSLSNRIKNDFPDDEVEIIDYNCRTREIFIKKCPVAFLYRRSIGEGIKKLLQTSVFRKSLNYLKLSKKNISVSIKKIEDYMSENYDVIVVGSDAVFNWNDIGLPNAYFLHGVNGPKKLSFAASSHLQEYNNASAEQKEYLKKALDDFAYLGVRDDNTARFVNEIICSDRTAHNCDPSIFLEMNFDEFDLKKKLKKHKFDFNKKTVFVMLMHPEYGEFTKKYFGDDYQIVSLMDDNLYSDVYLYDLNPFEWAHVFKYGECLITDYFHGTIFGLKNGIPVMSIDASNYSNQTYQSKAQDLFVNRLFLEKYYINSCEMKGEDGYSVFSERLSKILQEHNKDEVFSAIQKESENYKSFYEFLAQLHK